MRDEAKVRKDAEQLDGFIKSISEILRFSGWDEATLVVDGRGSKLTLIENIGYRTVLHTMSKGKYKREVKI